MENPTAQDRLLASFRSLVRAEFPQLEYLGMHQFTIVATDGSTVDCDPTDPASSMPSLAKVPLMTGLIGETVTLSDDVVGLHCTIVFLNADPSKPRCVGVDPRPGAAQAARRGDTVTITPEQFTAATPTATLSGPGAGTVVIAGSITATITGGSSKVSIP